MPDPNHKVPPDFGAAPAPDDEVDESSEESFPASDPPSWGAPVRVGAPRPPRPGQV